MKMGKFVVGKNRFGDPVENRIDPLPKYMTESDVRRNARKLGWTDVKIIERPVPETTFDVIMYG